MRFTTWTQLLGERWRTFRNEATQPLLAPGPKTTRPEWVSLLLLGAVVTAASLFAHFFKESALALIEWATEQSGPTSAASHLDPPVVFVVAATAIVVGTGLGRQALSRWPGRVGLHALAASTRGEDRAISLRATALRSTGTWVASVGLVSIGRESAIIETGGSIGSYLGRRFGGRGAALSAGGIAAAFASAYHAPIAALFYVEEHLRARTNRRTTVYSGIGAIGGHLLTVTLLGGKAIFPPPEGSHARMLVTGLVVTVPAALAARLFLEARDRVTSDSVMERLSMHSHVSVVAFAIVGGLLVALAPNAAGNGMEALRQSALTPVGGILLTLGIVKLLATTASLGAGTPGGVLTPTISVSAGIAGLSLLGLDHSGIHVGPIWDGMLAAMAVGIAVGLRSPLVAIFLVAEMSGDLSLIPVLIVIVALAWLFDRGIDALVSARGEPLPTGVHDEDA